MVVKTGFTPNEERSFSHIFVPCVKQISYEEINQAVFDSQFIKRMQSGDTGVKISNIDFNRILYLFILGMTLFPKSYYSVNPHNLSFIDDTGYFEKYPWIIAVYDEISRDLDLCRESLIPIREVKAMDVGLGVDGNPKSSLMYMVGCAMILPGFAI